MADDRYAADGVGVGVARRTSKGVLLLRRWLGCWIDFVALTLLFLAPALLLGALPMPSAVLGVAGLALFLLYFPVTEGLWGRSAGKLLSGTIVIDAMGRPPGLFKAAIRTLTRLIEVNPFLLGGLPAGLVAMSTNAHQRIGDLWAGTYVVPIAELRRAQTGAPPDIEAAAEDLA